MPQPKRVSYEIVPGGSFPTPPRMERASLAVRMAAQDAAEKLFRSTLLEKLGLSRSFIESTVVHGGWAGQVSASGQVLFQADTRSTLLQLYAAAIGLIWRQDAVAVSYFHPNGARLAVRIGRTDGRPLTRKQIRDFYTALHEADVTKKATIGFTEVDGRMLFVNASEELSDERFEAALTSLAEAHLPVDVYIDLARADFELESTNWSTDHGENYRERLRQAGRSDLLDWIESAARPEADRFLEGFDWTKGKARPTKRRKKGS